ncbi:MAG: hypothetical protein BWX71_00673 [Deltaproteobacteria bacterium ADurb.Bin072]|nr:MAG: hypothetical protein BWX71_00673 [Deltaproteobacteria bacterium ADurb.Bin072]
MGSCSGDDLLYNIEPVFSTEKGLVGLIAPDVVLQRLHVGLGYVGGVRDNDRHQPAQAREGVSCIDHQSSGNTEQGGIGQGGPEGMDADIVAYAREVAPFRQDRADDRAGTNPYLENHRPPGRTDQRLFDQDLGLGPGDEDMPVDHEPSAIEFPFPGQVGYRLALCAPPDQGREGLTFFFAQKPIPLDDEVDPPDAQAMGQEEIGIDGCGVNSFGGKNAPGPCQCLGDGPRHTLSSRSS